MKIADFIQFKDFAASGQRKLEPGKMGFERHCGLPKCMAAGTGTRSYSPKSSTGADCASRKGFSPVIWRSTGTKVTGTV